LNDTVKKRSRGKGIDVTEPGAQSEQGTVAVAEPTAADAGEGGAESRRGRPRSADTIARDDKIWAALTSPMTREQIVANTGVAANEVYLSLYRLKRDGRIQRERAGAQHVWSQVTPSA